MRKFALVAFSLMLSTAASAWSREWTDNTGKITQDADLVEFDDRIAVLKKASGRLVAVEIEDLSKADRDYLETQEAKDSVAKAASKEHTWNLTDGVKVTGRVVRYGRREVTIARRNGRMFVNDRPLQDVSPLQQTVLPRIVAYNEKKPITDFKGIESLIAARKGEPLTYVVDGVVLELEGGESFAVPFFLFSEKDLKILEPGWEAWTAAEKDKNRQDDESTMLRSMANEYQKDREIDHQIQMLRFASQWFDLWEVGLIAPNGAASSVVVPARNSAQASLAALQMYPTCQVGAIRRIARRY